MTGVTNSHTALFRMRAVVAVTGYPTTKEDVYMNVTLRKFTQFEGGLSVK